MNADSFHCHGGMPELEFQRLGIPARAVLDFSVNVSPLGPPAEITRAWSKLAVEMKRYPTIHGDGIVGYYHRKLDIPTESILAGNGSVELIYLAPRVLNLKRIAVVMPCFHDYARASEIAGAKVLPVELSKSTNFSPPSIEKLCEAVIRADALFIGNPNNPTGTLFSRNMILRLSEQFPDKWFMVDEAFVEFLDHYCDVTLARTEFIRRNILVFRSLTKFYSLPGLRIGCAIGHRQSIKRLAAFKEPWTVNRIAEKAAFMLIDCREYDEHLKQLVQCERTRLFERLQKMRGLRSFQPSANFFLCQWTATDDLDDLLKLLLSEGLYVRDCRNFQGLEQNFFRFAIRLRDENDVLLSAIKRCIEECRD